MSKISSNYFFNFTKHFDFLVETIDHGAFSPRYNLEDLSHVDKRFGTVIKIFILMKCFCDIPLNYLIGAHVDVYGSYGIGLNKSWGIKNNLTPIHYIPTLSSETWYCDNLASLYLLASGQKPDSQITDLIINYFIYTKPYDKKNGAIFYNEREWRYIPSLDKIKKISNKDLRIRRHFVLPNLDDDLGDLGDESDRLKNNEYISLKFNLKDVAYVIVERDAEVRKIANMIKGNNHIKIKKVTEIIKNRKTCDIVRKILKGLCPN